MTIDRPRRARAIRRGFTLLEMIVVVTIIALLATLVAPKLLGNIGTAKRRKAQHSVESLSSQVQIWMANEGLSSLPRDFSLEMLTEGDDRVLNPDDLIDPWKNAYVIEIPGIHNPDFDIVSYGEDGQPGGEGKAEDIRS
jgi:general secretion pathway protein G